MGPLLTGWQLGVAILKDIDAGSAVVQVRRGAMLLGKDRLSLMAMVLDHALRQGGVSSSSEMEPQLQMLLQGFSCRIFPSHPLTGLALSPSHCHPCNQI